MLDTTYQIEIRSLNPLTGSDGGERARLQKAMNNLLESMEQVAAKENRPLVEVIEELIRQARFPMIEFRTIYGERIACVKDGMQVWQMIMVARSYAEDTVAKTAAHVALKPEQAQAALDYYAAYPKEIDATLAENDEGFERLKRFHPQIQRYSITDEDLAEIDEKYPSLKELAP